MRNVCFIAYIIKKPEFKDYFRDFAASGLAKGYRLRGLNLGSIEREDVGFDVDYLPFAANVVFAGRWKCDPDFTVSVPEEVRLAAEFEKDLLSKFGEGLIHAILTNYALFLEGYLKANQPALVILGHQFSAQHQIAIWVCQRLGVPYIFNHPGVLNGTMVYEAFGQMGESEFLQKWDEYKQTPILDEDIKVAEEYLSRLGKGLLTRPGKSSTSADGALDIVKLLKMSGKPIVFYAGIADYRTGVQPRSYANASLHSAWIHSSVSGLSVLLRLAEEQDFYVIYKPHPIENETKSNSFKHGRVMVVKDATVADILGFSNVFCTICSSSCYEALAKGVPTILLGRMQASVLDVIYKPETPGELGHAIKACLVDGVRQGHSPEFVRHVALLLKRYYYRFSPLLADLRIRTSDDFWGDLERIQALAAKSHVAVNMVKLTKTVPGKWNHYKFGYGLMKNNKPWKSIFFYKILFQSFSFSYSRSP